jgi:phage terminase large subunit-like protein
VAHVAGLGALEDQMRRMTKQGYVGKGSPDRVDALVWAMTELILEPSRARRGVPMVRSLI